MAKKKSDDLKVEFGPVDSVPHDPPGMVKLVCLESRGCMVRVDGEPYQLDAEGCVFVAPEHVAALKLHGFTEV